MALPLTRNTTYAPGSEVKSADLNAIQDEIIAIHEDTRELPISVHGGQSIDDVTGTPVPMLPGNSSLVSSTTTARRWRGDIRLPVGARLLAVTVYGNPGSDAVAEAFTAKIWRTHHDGTARTQLSTTKTSTGTAATSIGWTTADTDFTPSGFTLVTGEAYYIEVDLPVSSSAAEIEFYSVKIEYDRCLGTP